MVYSTCSLFEEENEQVVEYVLEQMGENWELEKALPRWKHRGLRSYKVGEFCIRASPSEDQTNGFFVARFHRKTTPGTSTTKKTTTEETPSVEETTTPKDSDDNVPFYLRAKRPSESTSNSSEEPPLKKPKLSKSQRRRLAQAKKANKEN